MPNRTTFFVLLMLTLLAVLLGWNYFFHPLDSISFRSVEQEVPVVTPVASTSPDILADLSVSDRINQLIAMPVSVENETVNASDSAWVADHRPGFVTLFGQAISTVSAQIAVAQLKSSASLPTAPVAVLVDHEGGAVQRLNGSGFTRLPAWRTVCNQEASVSGQLLRQSAAELRQVGIDMVLSPVIDVAEFQPVLGSRICSGEPTVVAEFASEYILAFQEVGIESVLKHFPGIGTTTRDLHRNFDRVTVNPQEANLYRFLLDQFPELGVLVSHVGVTNQYPDIPCSLSQACIAELTNNYPQVLVMSDALEMEAAGFESEVVSATSASAALAREGKPLAERAIAALMAGNEVLIFGPTITAQDMSELVSVLETEYQTNSAFARQVDTHVRKVIMWKQLHL